MPLSFFLLFYRETPVAKTAVTGHRMGWFCTNCTIFSQHLNAHSSNWKEVGAEWLKPNQPYYGQRYHGSEFLSAPQLLMFPRSPCSTDLLLSTDWLFLYHSMDSSLGRAFLPLPRWFSLAACQPAVSGSD